MIHDQTPFSACRAYRDDVASRVRSFMPMVRKLAWHLAGSAPGAIDIDDLTQAGLVALVECAQRHEGALSDGFAAYAKMRVRGAMIDQLRAASPNPRGAARRRRELEDAQSRLRCRLGREPLAEEVAAAMGLTIAAYHRLRDESQGIILDPLDDAYSDADPAFADSEPDAEGILLQREDHAALAEAIAALPERLKLVVQLYFVEELNLAEIAAILDLSVPRVHQLKAQALEKLSLRIQMGPGWA